MDTANQIGTVSIEMTAIAVGNFSHATSLFLKKVASKNYMAPNYSLASL
jgi:hypothetical protein